jgi:bacitracin synthase 3
LLTQLKKHLPDYMIPSRIISIPQIPLTPNGKIDREQLLSLITDEDDATVYVAPSTATERLVESIWKDVLGLEKISVHQNLFEAGGHSLAGIRIVSRIQKELGCRIGLSDVFINPSISQLSALIEQKTGTTSTIDSETFII